MKRLLFMSIVCTILGFAVFAAAQAGRGARGGGVQRDLLYAAVPGRVDDIGFGGIGLVVFDASRNFRFVKRIPTWEYTAAQSPENVKGVAVSASLGMIYVSTIKRLAAWDLLTEKKVWEQTYDGECCDRMALSPDGKTMYVPSFEGGHWYVVDARTGDLIKKLPLRQLRAHITPYGVWTARRFLWQACGPPRCPLPTRRPMRL